MALANVQEAMARFYRRRGLGVYGSTNYVVTSAANTAATLTLPASVKQSWSIFTLHVSFSAAPAAPALLTVQDGANVVYKVYINQAQVTPIELPPLRGTEGNQMVVTLAAGGGTAVGVISALAVILES